MPGMLVKPKRVRDESVLSKSRESPCAVCGVTPCDPHHMLARGAGGGDTVGNVIPLCRRHHHEIHTIGRRRFFERHPVGKGENEREHVDVRSDVGGSKVERYR